MKMSFVWNYRGKTLITNASSQAAKFLGYEIKAQRANDYIDPKGRRGANGAIALLVPAKVIESKCQSFKRNGKVTHRNALLQDDDFSIVQQFQAEYRGLVQYYILAQNLSWFSTLYWVMETSLLKTLACKHRSSMKKQKKSTEPQLQAQVEKKSPAYKWLFHGPVRSLLWQLGVVSSLSASVKPLLRTSLIKYMADERSL